jgi:hypothetical protein
MIEISVLDRVYMLALRQGALLTVSRSELFTAVKDINGYSR